MEQNVHLILIDNQLYVLQKNLMWVKDLNFPKFNENPLMLNRWLSFLPSNFTEIIAAYQRPSGDLVLLIDKLIYVIKIPSFDLRYRMRYETLNINALNNEKINGIIHTNKGKTYIFYEDIYYVEINECSFTKEAIGYVHNLFPGAPTGFRSVFQFNNGNLYFMKQNKIYEYNDISKTLVGVRNLDLSEFGFNCPNIGILSQLYKILEQYLK